MTREHRLAAAATATFLPTSAAPARQGAIAWTMLVSATRVTDLLERAGAITGRP